MKRSRWVGAAALLTTLVFGAHVIAQEVQSLRGDNEVAAASEKPLILRYLKDDKPIARDYLQQPPLIPHKIDGYLINLKHNKCLSCHSWQNYKDSGATKVSQTHFESRDGAVLANIAARRYFCTQCHVPQVDAEPLVDNTFEPIDLMKH